MMMKTEIFAGLLALILGTAFTAALIPLLKKNHVGQSICKDVPAHQKKAGTPTMGGLAFVPAMLISTLPFVKEYPDCGFVLLMSVGFGLVGFTDDMMKLKRGKNEGLTAWQKLLGQLIITGVFVWLFMSKYAEATVIRLPFSGKTWDMGWLYVPFVILVVLGTDNGVNLTDGVDGLCSSVTAVVALCFLLMSRTLEAGLEPVCAAAAGALLGFLLFNTNPAKVFMGDTGSLALGGFVASAAVLLRQPLIILLVGFIYLCETLSVMIQRTYFKITHGKRIFKMTPIHHSFEKDGWSEARIVIVFTAVTVLCCGIALLGV